MDKREVEEFTNKAKSLSNAELIAHIIDMQNWHQIYHRISVEEMEYCYASFANQYQDAQRWAFKGIEIYRQELDSRNI